MHIDTHIRLMNGMKCNQANRNCQFSIAVWNVVCVCSMSRLIAYIVVGGILQNDFETKVTIFLLTTQHSLSLSPISQVYTDVYYGIIQYMPMHSTRKFINWIPFVIYDKTNDFTSMENPIRCVQGVRISFARSIALPLLRIRFSVFNFGLVAVFIFNLKIQTKKTFTRSNNISLCICPPSSSVIGTPRHPTQ